MAQKKSVLLVDADQREGRELFTALVRSGHSVTDTHRADYALELLDDRSFEAAILDVLSAGTGTHDLIRRLTEDWSNPLIMGMADFSVLLDTSPTVPRGAHFFMGKPIDIHVLVQRVSLDGPAAYGARGADILDYLRCIAHTGKNATVEVIDLHGNLCTFFLAEGSLIHAVCGAVEGEEALFESLAFEEGAFSHVPWSPPERTTIQQSTESVLSRAHGMLDARQCRVESL